MTGVRHLFVTTYRACLQTLTVRPELVEGRLVGWLLACHNAAEVRDDFYRYLAA